MQVRSLGWEDPLEEALTVYSTILAWEIPWTEEPGELQSMGSQRVGHNWATRLHVTSTLMTDKWRGTLSLLMKVKEEGEKAGLKFNIQKTKIMASDRIIPWQIDGEKMKNLTNFIFLGSNITADGDCSHEIKRCWHLGRKAMTNLDSILKSRHITLPTKVHLVKAMVFPVVMYGCESLTIKKAEHRRIAAFELWYWRRLLRVLWTTGDQTSQS